jgi:hypothetical protein
VKKLQNLNFLCIIKVMEISNKTKIVLLLLVIFMIICVCGPKSKNQEEDEDQEEKKLTSLEKWMLSNPNKINQLTA